MKKCPFYAEEIKDEAIKCRFCGEWLENFETIKPEIIKTDMPTFDEDRVLCPNDACIGVLNSDGVCSECGKTSDEIITTADHYDGSKLYETVDWHIKQFKKIFWMAIAASSLMAGYGYLLEILETGGSHLPSWLYLMTHPMINVLIVIFGIGLGIAVLAQVAKFANLLGKSRITWVGLCIIIPFFFVYAYVHLTNEFHRRAFSTNGGLSVDVRR